MQQMYSKNFNVKALPKVNKIMRFFYGDELPPLPKGKICVWIGNHKKMSESLVRAIDDFCKENNAAVFTDHTSLYNGKFRVNYALVDQQLQNTKENPDLMIYIGDVSGAYYGRAKNVWRVNLDGEFRDCFRALRNVFEMDEEFFFKHYAAHSNGNKGTSYFESLKSHLERLRALIPEIPFSNLWLASVSAKKIPQNSKIHLGILNTLRTWNFFDFPDGVEGFSNTGGFGIDGCLSSCIGSALANPACLHFCIIGDLAFFYDMNALGNRHILPNLRVLLVNNGRGTEFRNFNHPGSAFGSEADSFIAAGGHYGNKSPDLVRHYAKDLGFEYFCAQNKEEYLLHVDEFFSPKIGERPALFEIFTDYKDESRALEIVMNLEVSAVGSAKSAAKKILGEKGVRTVKKLLGR